MGIDVTDKLLVGVRYGELEEWIKNKVETHEDDNYGYNEHDVIEEYFEYMSPYYDSDKDDWFIGFRVPNHQNINEELLQTIQETAVMFEELTGLKPRLKGGADVY